MEYRGLYINLDRSPERRAALERQLAALGIGERYVRFAAIDGATLARKSPLRPGEVGVFASHLAAIETVAEGGTPVHVLEDDAALAPALVPASAGILAGAIERYDIVFTEVMVPPNLQGLKMLKAQYDAAMAEPTPEAIARRLQTMDLARFNFSGMTSYFVTPRGAGRLLPLLRREWQAGPRSPVDNFVREQVHQARISAACVFPFVTSIDLGSISVSTAGVKRNRDSALVLGLLRYAFFVGADFGMAERRLAEMMKQGNTGEGGEHGRLIASLLGVIISDRFELY